MKSLAWLVPLLLVMPFLLSGSDANADGLRVRDAQLVRADGTALVMRGAAHGHAWYPDRTATAVGDLAMLGANTVRVVLTGGRFGPASDVAQVVAACRANRVVCVLDFHDTTGFGEAAGAVSLERAVDFWLGARDALVGHENHVIVNVGNEPFGNVGQERWTADTVLAVQRLRAGGLRHVLMVDAPNWGQDWQFVMRDNASAVWRADPQRNVLFSVHMYGVFRDAAAVGQYRAAFERAGLALVVGEFGRGHAAGEPDVSAVMGSGIGLLAWLWSGGGDGTDLVSGFHPYRLTSWGREWLASLKPLRAPGRMLGAAVDARALANDPVYRMMAGRELRSVTPENAFKWDAVQPSKGDYRFDDADRVVAFARAVGATVHGHTLVWHLQAPDWLRSTRSTSLRQALRDHVSVVVGRYSAEPAVGSWDVVNEVVGDDGRLRDSFWLRALGQSYIADAFRLARAADPDAVLCINEYGAEGVGPKSDGLFELVKRLRAEGVPVDCVGFQAHLSVSEPLPAEMARNLRRFKELGVQVRVTELDVRVPVPASEASLALQAKYFEAVARACAGLCTGITLWGFTDRYSWVPSTYPGFGSALVFDEQYRVKPAYAAIRDQMDGRHY